MRLTFVKICSIAAAVACLNQGQTFQQIAKSANVTPATVRRWVRKAGFRKVGDKYIN